MLVLTVGSFSVFGEIFEMTVNYQSDLAFWGFPSFLFSLHTLLISQGLSADAPPPGPTAAAAVALTVRAAPPPRAPRRGVLIVDIYDTCSLFIRIYIDMYLCRMYMCCAVDI